MMQKAIHVLATSAGFLLLLAGRSTAVSTLPCPSVGAQPPSTPTLAMGQDNACENWEYPSVNQPGANISSSNLSYVLIAGNLDGANLSDANMAFLHIPPCPGLSARNADLSFSNLKNSRLICSDFSGANFTGADLTAADSDYAPGTSFAGANFTNANLTNFRSLWSNFSDATFAGATLSGVSFAESTFARTNFIGQDLWGTQFLGGNLSDADFSFADLTAVKVYNYNSNRPTRLDRVNFSGSIMIEFEVVWAREAIGVIFADADLSYASLDSWFTDADFSNAILHAARLNGEFRDCDLTNAVLTNADLSYARLFGSNLTGAQTSAGTILAGATYDAFTVFPSGYTFVGPTWGLPGGLSPAASGMVAVFSGNDLSGLDYSGLDMSGFGMGRVTAVGTNFSSAILSGANLQSSNLRGARFAGANVSGANFAYSTYDELTIFPSGGTYEQPPWGLPNGVAPWSIRMVPAPEPSSLLSLAAGMAWLAGLSTMRGMA